MWRLEGLRGEKPGRHACEGKTEKEINKKKGLLHDQSFSIYGTFDGSNDRSIKGRSDDLPRTVFPARP
jgi:hypothetical protein